MTALMLEERISQLEAAIAALEAQRGLLGDAIVDVALPLLRRELAEIHEPPRAMPAPALEAERKLVTVLFADISGFTALSEELDPEQVRSLMNSCFTQLVPVVLKYQGTVERFLGDAIVALFGAPLAHEDDPQRALHTALELMDALQALNAEQGATLQLHIGINTGLVVAGGIGSPDRQQYSVMGDAINLAARLEDAAEPGAIFVGPETYRLAAGLFDFEPLAPIQVKGRAAPVAPYRLLRAKTNTRPLPGLAGLRSPFVGRAAELSALDAALAELGAGSGSIVAVVGAAGIGKSRLISEAHATFFGRAVWVEGHSLSFTEEISYGIARELLHGLIGTDLDEPAAQVRASLQDQAERLCGDQAVDVYPYLARLLELPLDEETEERLRYLDAEALQRRIFSAFREFVRMRAIQQPLVLVCEDLHWADPSSIDLLQALTLLVDEVPLLLLLVFRPAEGAIQRLHQRLLAGDGSRYRVIEAPPLDEEMSRRLLHNLLRTENLGAETRSLLLAKAEGNPFFLEELLRTLMDSGLIMVDGDRAFATQPIAAIDLPNTLQGVIVARVDRLSTAEKRVLQTAAVIGRHFERRLLGRMLENELSDDQLEQALQELQRREFIQPQATGLDLPVVSQASSYLFKNALIQEATYASLLIARRKALHRRVGETLERLSADSLDEVAATLGFHFEKADIAEKAVRYLTQAGDDARMIFANAEAMGFYRAALHQAKRIKTTGPGGRLGASTYLAERIGDLLTSGKQHDDARASTYLAERIGDLLASGGQHDDARAAYEEALQAIFEPDPVTQARLQRKIGNVWTTQREYEAALEAYAAAEAALDCGRPEEKDECQEEWVQIRLQRMFVHYWRAEVREITELAETMRPVIASHNAPAQRAAYYMQLANMNLRRDRYHVADETLAYCRAAVEASEQAGDLQAMTWARFALGGCLLFNGELDEAEREVRAALALAERMGDVGHQSRCLTYLALVARKRRDVEGAREASLHSLQAATAGQMLEYIAMAEANLAWVAWREDNLHAALLNGRAALQMWQKIPLVYPFQWTALWPLLAVALAQERPEEAIAHAYALLEPRQQRMPEDLELALGKATEAWEQGQVGRSWLERALELAQEEGYL